MRCKILYIIITNKVYDMEFFNIPYLPYQCNITVLLHSIETEEDRETCVVNVYPNFLPLVSQMLGTARCKRKTFINILKLLAQNEGCVCVKPAKNLVCSICH